MQCRVGSSKEKIQPVPEFSYSLTGIFCLFLLSFCLQFSTAMLSSAHQLTPSAWLPTLSNVLVLFHEHSLWAHNYDKFMHVGLLLPNQFLASASS